MFKSFFVVFILALFPHFADAGTFPGRPLVIDETAHTPFVGIQLRIPVGTHIYGPEAENPDQRTTLRIEAGKDVSAGNPVFPPTKMLPSGVRGYTGEPIFWVPVQNHMPDKTQTILFYFTYLECNETCTPVASTHAVTLPSPVNQVVPVNLVRPPEQPVRTSSDTETSFPFSVLLFAFIGGILLNFMPCVFPMLSLKAFSVSKKRETFFYTGGVLTGFIGFAVLIFTLKQLGTQVGWGFQMQSPVFVFIMTLLFFVMGLMAADLFPAPLFSVKRSGSSSFLTGLLAVLIASPCTAPFMGAAVGIALLHASPLIFFLIFACLGIGFAFPFLLIALIPGLSKKLPKPGKWMVHFKVLMAFFLFAAAVWLCSVFVILTSASWLIVLLSTLLFLAGLGFCLKEKLYKTAVCAFLFFLTFVHFFAPTAQQNSWEPFSEDSLQFAADRKIMAFVKGTAAWCLTCSANEALLETDSIHQLFRDHGVMLLSADYTKKDPVVFDWLKRFGRSGVPLYVVYGKKGPLVLPALLTYDILKEALNDNTYF